MKEEKIREFMSKYELTDKDRVIKVLRNNMEEETRFRYLLSTSELDLKKIKRLKKWQCPKEWLSYYNDVVELSKKIKSYWIDYAWFDMGDNEISFGYNLHFNMKDNEIRIEEKDYPNGDWSVIRIDIFTLNNVINLLKKWGYLESKGEE